MRSLTLPPSRPGGRLGRVLPTAAVLAAAFSGGLATPAAHAEPKWPAPALSNPQTIQLGTGATSTTLDKTRDYIVKLPATKKVGATAIIGGRNVVIVGGHITVPDTATTDFDRRAIYIKDNAGTVHIEGVLIDSSGGAPSDAIAIAAPASTVQVQNVRVEDLKGSQSGWHADIIQPWGGVKELRVDRLTGSSSYQGLFLRPDLKPIGATHLSNINLRQPAGGAGRLVWWVTKDATTGECLTPATSTLSEVYAVSDGGTSLASLIYPHTTTSGCPASITNGAATWSSLAITGHVKSGTPPTGDFVPRGLAGTAYTPGSTTAPPTAPPTTTPPPTNTEPPGGAVDPPAAAKAPASPRASTSLRLTTRRGYLVASGRTRAGGRVRVHLACSGKALRRLAARASRTGAWQRRLGGARRLRGCRVSARVAGGAGPANTRLSLPRTRAPSR